MKSPPSTRPPDSLTQAVTFLEQAASIFGQDSAVLYLLFQAYKRQGKRNEARATLRRIRQPDANVLLQLALLSLQENQLVQAESELARAWDIDPTCYEIAYNLILTRLTLGKYEETLALLPQAEQLLSTRTDPKATQERRFLLQLQQLVRCCLQPSRVELLGDLLPEEEKRLVEVIHSLGQVDTVLNLLRALHQVRPRSRLIRERYLKAALVKGKELVDRCQWTEAELLLRPLIHERGFSRENRLALLNLLGCCACVTHDFEGAISLFTQAIGLQPNEPLLHQNLALCHEWNGSMQQADLHWNRYFDLLNDKIPAPADVADYRGEIGYLALERLANRYAEKENWSAAINYLQRATQVRPNQVEALERLFHFYNQAKRPADARRTLEQLRRLRPSEPQYELYELDLIEVKGLGDIERLLTEIDRIRQRYPNNSSVEERAMNMVSNVIPLMGNLCDQLTDQLGKILDQIRNLPNYQINWSAVREVMRDLIKEFQKLRRITGKCLPLVNSEEHRRAIRDLAEHIDKKIEACRSIGS